MLLTCHNARVWCRSLVIHRWVGLNASRELLASLLELSLGGRVGRGSIDGLSSFSSGEDSSLVLNLNVNWIISVALHLARPCRVLAIRFRALILHVGSWGRPIHSIIHHARLIHVLLSIHIERVLSRLLSLHVTLRGCISLNSCIIRDNGPTYYSKSRRILGLPRSLLVRSSLVVTLHRGHLHRLREALRHLSLTLGNVLLRALATCRLLTLAWDISVMAHPGSKLALSIVGVSRHSSSLSLTLLWEALLLLSLRIYKFNAFIIIIILFRLELHGVLLLAILSTCWRQSRTLVHDRHLSLQINRLVLLIDKLLFTHLLALLLKVPLFIILLLL